MAINSFPQVLDLFKKLDQQYYNLVSRSARFQEDQNPVFIEICDITNDLRFRMIEFMASQEDPEETPKTGMHISTDVNSLMKLYEQWWEYLEKIQLRN